MPIETRRKYGRIPTRQTRAPAMQPSFAAALAELVAGASGPPEIALPDDYRQPVITPERVGSTLHNALPDAAPNVGTTPNRRRMPMLPGLDASAEPIFRQDVGRSAMARALEEYMPDRTAAVVGERNVRHFDPSSGGPAPDWIKTPEGAAEWRRMGLRGNPDWQDEVALNRWTLDRQAAGEFVPDALTGPIHVSGARPPSDRELALRSAHRQRLAATHKERQDALNKKRAAEGWMRVGASPPQAVALATGGGDMSDNPMLMAISGVHPTVIQSVLVNKYRQKMLEQQGQQFGTDADIRRQELRQKYEGDRHRIDTLAETDLRTSAMQAGANITSSEIVAGARKYQTIGELLGSQFEVGSRERMAERELSFRRGEGKTERELRRAEMADRRAAAELAAKANIGQAGIQAGTDTSEDIFSQIFGKRQGESSSFTPKVTPERALRIIDRNLPAETTIEGALEVIEGHEGIRGPELRAWLDRRFGPGAVQNYLGDLQSVNPLSHYQRYKLEKRLGKGHWGAALSTVKGGWQGLLPSGLGALGDSLVY